MAKLILKLDDRELQDCPIGSGDVTIGRRLDNTLVIPNGAVSGCHARVYREGERFIIEDLKSTNGTFIDGKPITRHTLRDGDILIIGNHTVVFSTAGGDDDMTADPEAALRERAEAPLDMFSPQTMMGEAAIPKTEHAAPPPQLGMLKVMAGEANAREYVLTAHTSIIGTADTALIRLSGWFKPKMAAAIARKGDGYSATALEGKVKVNGEVLKGRYDLKDGDLVEVSGLTLEFRLKPTRR